MPPMPVRSVEQPTLRDVQVKQTAQPRRASPRARRSAADGALDISPKRLCDVVVSLIVIPVLLPAMLIIAALIKADSRGPVLFRQLRYGRDQKTFVILKFRTMTAHPSSEGREATREDRRVTRVGRVLRKCSLDEVPQIFNVLRGDMSLVGPRPHPIWKDEVFFDLIRGYGGRYRVKPGITGLAQISGCRGETRTTSDMRRRIEKDLEYVEKQSLAFDLKILLLTVPSLLHLRDAY
jgi:lipopolysaccharide/colanic/teichoic acid biosynthesis glycosyltransferase